ncbi:MAG TPA: c-type cytochrome [Falsiroseomonas sp.]|jgi:mono/diheme cytochrome c family protein|nr:c-type cytochrome [Falsiroseomonas sp.]
MMHDMVGGGMMWGMAALGWRPPAAIVGAGGPAQVALGQRVYVEHCASCHGANLQVQSAGRLSAHGAGSSGSGGFRSAGGQSAQRGQAAQLTSFR